MDSADVASRNAGLKPLLASASLRMVRKGLPVEVQCIGVRMLLVHLVYFRKKELSGTQFADLRKALVGSFDDMVLKDTTTVSGDPMGSTANPKENNKHKRCLLVVLAVNINSRSLAAMQTVVGKDTGHDLAAMRGATTNRALLHLQCKVPRHFVLCLA
ncbi:hypothetical protein ACP70R_010643 [Stipagrostis hirtigluma subsp. patula]